MLAAPVDIHDVRVPYVYAEYPRVLYHPSGATVVVQSDAERDAAVADGYTLTPVTPASGAARGPRRL